MQNEINLLARKNVGFFQQARTLLLVRAIAIFSVIIVVSSFIGIFLLGKNYSPDAVATQQTNIRSRLALYHDKAIQELTLVDRVNHIQAILKSRISLSDKITTLQKQLSPDIKMQSLAISQTTAAMLVSSPSLDSLKTFLDGITLMVNKKIFFQNVTINTVSVDSVTGMYSVAIQGTLL